PDPPGKIVGGRIMLDDTDILKLSETEMQRIRGARIAMSFQDPMTFLNPVHKVGNQIAEAIIKHQGLEEEEAFEKAVDLMRLVQIPDALMRAVDYPHQLSGGMRQRILLAIALSCQPSLLIADEPTTALDVVVQADVLDLLRDLKNKLDLSVLLITHDMGVVAALADRIAVMYAGRIMEIGSIHAILKSSKHPYTIGLLNSLPSIDEEQSFLYSIPGDVPDMLEPPSGCPFHPRCPYSIDICQDKVPVLQEYDEGHFVACVRAEEKLN
ncbi:unnamed protein product, partial [marine sediment metagenome]